MKNKTHLNEQLLLFSSLCCCSFQIWIMDLNGLYRVVYGQCPLDIFKNSNFSSAERIMWMIGYIFSEIYKLISIGIYTKRQNTLKKIVLWWYPYTIKGRFFSKYFVNGKSKIRKNNCKGYSAYSKQKSIRRKHTWYWSFCAAFLLF